MFDKIDKKYFKRGRKIVIKQVISLLLIITFVSAGYFFIVQQENLTSPLLDDQDFLDEDIICENILHNLILTPGETINGTTNWEESLDIDKEIETIGLAIDEKEISNSMNFGCFPGKSKVILADRTYKNIEEIKIDDLVLSYNIKDKKFEKSRVKYVYSTTTDIGIYSINNGLIYFTGDHPFFVKKSNGAFGWSSVHPSKSEMFYDYRDVDSLSAGDEIFSSVGGWIRVTSIDFHPNTIKVYGLQLDFDTHCYFVEDILVSNGNYYVVKGYQEGISSLNEENYIILSLAKIMALDDISYNRLKEMLDVPARYNFKITINMYSGSNLYTFTSTNPSVDYSSSEVFVVREKNVLVWTGQSLRYGSVTVELYA